MSERLTAVELARSSKPSVVRDFPTFGCAPGGGLAGGHLADVWQAVRQARDSLCWMT